MLKPPPVDPAAYDVIFVGSPNWWGTIAPPVMTFLTSADFSGKTIAPFVTHGAAVWAAPWRTSKSSAPKPRVVLPGLAVYIGERGGCSGNYSCLAAAQRSGALSRRCAVFPRDALSKYADQDRIYLSDQGKIFRIPAGPRDSFRSGSAGSAFSSCWGRHNETLSRDFRRGHRHPALAAFSPSVSQAVHGSGRPYAVRRHSEAARRPA